MVAQSASSQRHHTKHLRPTPLRCGLTHPRATAGGAMYVSVEASVLRQNPAGSPSPCLSPDSSLPGQRPAAYTWQLPHEARAAALARRLTKNALAHWSIGNEDEILLAVSELVTNSVEHGRAPLSLQLAFEESTCSVQVHVCDGGPSSYAGSWSASCGAEEHGRGLLIIEALASANGSRVHTWGVTHWAILPATQRPA
ncbi:ATP-binding protein [Streptomyces sp. NPDC004787]|uniref:ATP-binding protein n=1 Tax=Streptomyces sp. NPDC004787 TaxID=3154291 RepID=UPI0033A1DE08